MAVVKAAVSTRYGLPEVVHLLEVPQPPPKLDELLVRVRHHGEPH
jgi:NADPH:quinone reductase-like Zn-dependent oxidoreductase